MKENKRKEEEKRSNKKKILKGLGQAWNQGTNFSFKLKFLLIIIKKSLNQGYH